MYVSYTPKFFTDRKECIGEKTGDHWFTNSVIVYTAESQNLKWRFGCWKKKDEFERF